MVKDASVTLRLEEVVVPVALVETTDKVPPGVIVPMPTLPEESIVMPEVADPEVISPILLEPTR